MISTATNTVIVVFSASTVGNTPAAFGLFIQSAPVVFSAFTAKLAVSSFQPKFTLLSNFTLGGTLSGPPGAVQALSGGADLTSVPCHGGDAGEPAAADLRVGRHPWNPKLATRRMCGQPGPDKGQRPIRANPRLPRPFIGTKIFL